METMTGKGIEAIAVRRASVADGDKVRYRVYRSAQDYVVVIAENALMAVKVSGINAPLRIVRDIAEQSTLPAGRIVAEEAPSVAFSLTPKERKGGHFPTAEPAAPSETPIDFLPLTLGDLQRKSVRKHFFSADELGHAAAAASPPPPAPPPAVAQSPVPPPAEAPPPVDMGEPVEIPPGGVLSPEEVARLLGE